MEQNDIIRETERYVQETLGIESSGHDWWHAKRVHNKALHIAKEEAGIGKDVDTFVVRLAALLHDIEDWKFSGGDDLAGPKKAEKWLEGLGVERKIISHVSQIIKDLSFKGAMTSDPMTTIEGAIVQDADRLDALGAIGIARCFATGVKLGNAIHEPGETPILNKTREEYKKLGSSSINHFYEKLFLLKDRMKTEAGRRLAAERHRYMEDFLARFLREWDGKI